jgi:G patch domain-containing protein 1
MVDQHRRYVRIAGFGLGALNDAEDDDVDVYDGGLNHSRNRMAYDTSDRDDEDRAMVTGRSERGRHKSAPGVVCTPFFQWLKVSHILKRSTSLLQTFHDGSPVLAGFMLSDKPLVEDQLFVTGNRIFITSVLTPRFY